MSQYLGWNNISNMINWDKDTLWTELFELSELFKFSMIFQFSEIFQLSVEDGI